jgi:hypothetical protein
MEINTAMQLELTEQRAGKTAVECTVQGCPRRMLWTIQIQ